MPTQGERLAVEVVLLDTGMDMERAGLCEGDFQYPPCLSRLVMRLEFAALDPVALEQEWEVVILPHGISTEIQEMQIIPWRLKCVASEGVSRVVARLDELTSFVLFLYTAWSKDPLFVGIRSQIAVDSTLLPRVDRGCRDAMFPNALHRECDSIEIELTFHTSDLRPLFEAAIRL